MGLQRFPIGDFRGGWNIRDAPQELEPNEAQSMLNCTLAPLGSLQQREGKTRFDASGFPANPARADNMKAWYPVAGTKVLFLSIDGDIYTSDTAGALTLRFNGTAGTVWAFEPMQDSAGTLYMWCMNGTDNPKKINAALAVADWLNSPPNGTMLKVWRNLMCVSGRAATPRRVFFSDIGNPESPAATYGTRWTDIAAADDEEDKVNELNVFMNDLWVFKGDSTWRVTNPAAPWDSVRTADEGCTGRFQSDVLDSKIYFLNRRGVFSINSGLGLSDETNQVHPLWTDATPRVNFGVVSKFRVMATPAGRVLISLALDAATQPNYVLEIVPAINYRRQGGRSYRLEPAILIHDFEVSSMEMFRTGDSDVLIAGASDTNRLHTLFDGTNDDGVAISSYWLTGWKSLISEEPYERIRRLNVELFGKVTVDVLRDFSSVIYFTDTKEVGLPADSLWDGGTWDGGTWDPASDTALVRFRPESRARYHAVRFRNAEFDKTFKIYAAEVALRGGKEH